MNNKDKADSQDLDSNNLIQAVILTLDDGTTAVFSGRAVCKPGETLTVSKIQFTEPKPLPDDCHFEFL